MFRFILISILCFYSYVCDKESKVGEYPYIQSKMCGIGRIVSERDRDIETRIISGKNASLGQFPWMAVVSIRTPSGDEYIEEFCGGALIGDRVVVTAANCFYELTDESFVIAGTIDRQSDQYYSRVEKIVIHERFNRSDPIGTNFDIALVFLSNDDLKPRLIDENEDKTCCYLINSICLPKSNISNTEGEPAVISGFGVNEPNFVATDTPNQYLKWTEYRLSDPSKCDPRQVCVYETEYPSCWGDSGSPLFQMDGQRAVLIGILTTVGTESKTCGRNWQYFTRISYFVDWIITKTKLEINVEEEEKSKVGKAFTSIFIIVAFILLIVGIIFLVYCVYQRKREAIKSLETVDNQKSDRDNKK